MSCFKTILRACGGILLVTGFAACSKPPVVGLPDSSTLGNPRGLRMARVITHYHSPYSYDACDNNGLPGGVLNASCLADLRNAICTNRIDMIFMTDHPSNMQNYEMSSLLLQQGSDQLLPNSTAPYLNQMDCGNGFKPVLTVGFEGRLLALGMEKHAWPLVADRTANYGNEDLALANQLRSASNAAVFIPHTESRSVSLIQSIQPDGIEIYNTHANLDPKIRMPDLGLKPFSHLPGILTYLIDPYKDLNADYIFLQFLYVAPIYEQTWDTLIFNGGKNIAGIGGSDSHENIFPQTAADGERLDAHRRLTRFMSNHLPVTDLQFTTIKNAIKTGQGWLVFEGFGSPVGMDFYATAGATTVGPGGNVSLASGGGSGVIHVSVPTLHPDSPQKDEAPALRVILKKVTGVGQDTIVASSGGTPIDYTVTSPGFYRAEILMRPRHIRSFLGPFSDLADNEYPWIITNHVEVKP